MRVSENRSRPLAKQLRRSLTNAETILWSRLRRHAMWGLPFRRQHPVGPFIADFACVTARLIIEVDGGTHSTEAEVRHDRRRDAYLRKCGWCVVRVHNEDVYKNLDGVLELIGWKIKCLRKAPSVAHSGDTSPVNGGGKVSGAT